MMLKNIHISELRPGMHIVNPGLDWKKHPYLYAEEKHIASQEEIASIAEAGYLEFVIDLDRSDASAFNEYPEEAPPKAEKPSSTKPKVALEEELPKAIKVHDESVAYARQFMSDMRKGTVNLSQAETVVENIMESLERNTDALLSLSRLHHTDSYTYTHCVNVAVLTTVFARYSGMELKKVFIAGNAGLFHDLGKALIPLPILNAPRKLSEAEFSVMRRHPQFGHEQLRKVAGVAPEVLDGALEHHEHHNGNGYPKGLKGDEISFVGKVVGVSDVYDALTSRRVYKAAMYPHKALGIMYQMRGKEFDPSVVADFIRMVGIYPVGSVVVLEDGWTGVVTASDPERPMHPTVTLARDPLGNRVNGPTLDATKGECPPIKSCKPAEEAGIDPLAVLTRAGVGA